MDPQTCAPGETEADIAVTVLCGGKGSTERLNCEGHSTEKDGLAMESSRCSIPTHTMLCQLELEPPSGLHQIKRVTVILINLDLFLAANSCVDLLHGISISLSLIPEVDVSKLECVSCLCWSDLLPSVPISGGQPPPPNPKVTSASVPLQWLPH